MWQLTMPLRVMLIELWFLCQEFERHRPAWHFLAKNSSPATLVGLMAFLHYLNRKRWSHSDPFALCTYAKWFDCLLCSGASRSWQRLKAFSTVLTNNRGPSSITHSNFTQFYISCPKLYTSALVAILYTFVTLQCNYTRCNSPCSQPTPTCPD